MKKVLITGASGYIGKHITLRLLNEGYSVRASVRNLDKSAEVIEAVRPQLTDASNLNERLTFVQLDLENDQGWSEALSGIDILMHTASPFPIASPKNEDEVIVPAVQGTLRALRAAKQANVKRIILTSSVAAIYGTDLPKGKTSFDETIYTDVNHKVGSQTYTKSKTLAESAAWSFIKNESPEIALTTINPVLVLGAPLDNNFGSSVSLIERILAAKDPMLPNLSFSIVDVRDVAKMHVDSIMNKNTFGERIIASSESMSFIEISKFLKSKFPERKFKTMQAPNFVVRILALFDADIKSILPQLGDRTPVNSAKATDLLGIKFIAAKDSVLETAKYLLTNS